MKNKKDVYLVVDTPKKAKKLKKVLDMFGEKIYYEPNHEDDDRNGINTYWGYGFSNGGWQGVNTNFAGHCMNIFKEVSIKELRNILAVEHLKEGDYVACEHSGDVAVGVFKEWEPRFGFDIDNCRYKDGSTSDGGCFDNFIRYATEAEKELLRVNSLKEQAKGVIKPISEALVIGKWYKFDSYGNNYLLLYNGSDYAYGFMNYKWDDNWIFSKNGLQKRALGKEATHEEVEKALIEEAKRRGFKEGVFIKSTWLTGHKSNLSIGSNFQLTNNELLVGSKIGCYTIFKDGQWAEVADKFAELKEAHNNGYGIQFYDKKRNKWLIAECLVGTLNLNTAIKPEEKPKVGDLVKAWDNDERDFIIGKLNYIDSSIFPFRIHSTCYENAKKITPQEAKELLTDYCR